MYKWENAVITTRGLSLLAKLTSGNTLSLVRAVIGAGYVRPDILKYQSIVTDEKQELSFSAQSYPEDGVCAVPVRLFNTGLSAGYTAKQIGIYAMDPDDGEILFLIAQASDGEGTDIPSESEMPGYSAEWTFYMRYGQADGVNVTVDPANTVNEEEVLSIIQKTVTPEWLGLGKVDNTSDTNKYVAYAQRAGVADKAKYTLTVRLDGGRTEGVNMWTFDGSTSKTVNVTAAKICAEPAIESTDYPGCYYRTVEGRTEWLNPPMIAGVEYCTTERYNGSPVYTKLFNPIDIGVGTTTFTDDDIFDNLPQIIRSEEYVRSKLNGRHLAVPVIGGLVSADDVMTSLGVSVTSTFITCTNNTDDDYWLNVHIWYIK